MKRSNAAAEFITSVTTKGQVTLPSPVRKVLGVRPKDKVSFRIEDGEVKLVPLANTLESAFGAVRPLRSPEDFEKRVRDAKEARAQAIGSKLQHRRRR